ncbi:MAG: hypothetical protein P8101_15925 [Candidatus Thiodiazotropha sp.]|jgi:hypothetical protein
MKHAVLSTLGKVLESLPSIAMVESISKALKTPLSVLVFIAAENEEIPELNEGQLNSLSTGIMELMDGTRKQQSLF